MSMKIAILSDMHIGYDRFRKDAFLQAKEALEKACRMADAIIIPGDIFDARFPKPDVIAEAIVLFRDAPVKEFGAEIIDFKGEKEIHTKKPILAIPGTHERRTGDTEDPVDLLNLTSLLANIGMGVAILGKGEERVAVTGISGVAEERFREALEKHAASPVRGAFNILVFHQSIYELLPFNDSFLRIEELPKGYDLYVDGHIHNRVEKTVHGKPFLIPGSTVLTQLKDGETGGKGFFVYDTESGSAEFVKINSRSFDVLKIELSGVEKEAQVVSDIEDGISAVLGSKGKGSIIRIEIKGSGREIKKIEIGLQEVMKRHRDDAVIEISRKGADEIRSSVDESAHSADFDSLSVSDKGMGILLSELGKSGYSMKMGPTELFDMLSSGEKKDKVIERILKELLS